MFLSLKDKHLKRVNHSKVIVYIIFLSDISIQDIAVRTIKAYVNEEIA